MRSGLIHRPRWEIDTILEGLVGEDVRVAAAAFAPPMPNGKSRGSFIPANKLILPDNSSAEGLPVYFEGRLWMFARQIGVVHALLGPPVNPDKSVDGIICFRGNTAVILRGPATVELAFPFKIERLPRDGGNYWNDLQFPNAQFILPI